MRWAAGVAFISVALLVSACGSAETQRAQPADQLAPAPPIETIDEPAHSFFFNEPDVERIGAGTGYICLARDEEDEECEPTPAERAAAEKSAREFREATWPESKPLGIARLSLEHRRPPANATLVTWRARSGKLCTLIEVSDESGGGGGGPSGPCVPGTRGCGEICLELSGEGDGADLVYLLAGTVAATADELRIEFIDGKAVRYPLVGPIVREFPKVRVFMLDLGPRLYRRLELLEDDDVVDKVEVPQSEIDTHLCFRKHPMRLPENPLEQPTKDPNPERSACMRNAYPKEDDDG
ncbi:MAG TPA: hypothetical protein VFL41_07235 [Gaiellaceae bacterium]|nr:hypothetical protein [Gaiellaceae bacterium]